MSSKRIVAVAAYFASAAIFLIVLLLGLKLLKTSSNDVKTVMWPQRYISLWEQTVRDAVFVTTENRTFDTGTESKAFDGLDTRLVHIRTDTDRAILPRPHANDWQLRIMFLGGSTTENVVADEDKRWANLSGKLLSESTGYRIDAINLGRAGATSYNALFSYLVKADSLHPDIVVVLEAINDMNTLLLSDAGNYVSTHDRLLKTQLGPWDNLCDWLTRIFNSIRTGPQTPQLGKATRPKTPAELNAVKEEYKMSLTTFIHAIKVRGEIPVLATQFNRIQLNDAFAMKTIKDKAAVRYMMSPPAYVQFYADFNQIIRDVAKREGVKLIDLDAIIPHDRRYIYDQVHLNNAGSQLAAEAVSQQLRPIVLERATATHIQAAESPRSAIAK